MINGSFVPNLRNDRSVKSDDIFIVSVLINGWKDVDDPEFVFDFSTLSLETGTLFSNILKSFANPKKFLRNTLFEWN